MKNEKIMKMVNDAIGELSEIEELKPVIKKTKITFKNSDINPQILAVSKAITYRNIMTIVDIKPSYEIEVYTKSINKAINGIGFGLYFIFKNHIKSYVKAIMTHELYHQIQFENGEKFVLEAFGPFKQFGSERKLEDDADNNVFRIISENYKQTSLDVKAASLFISNHELSRNTLFKSNNDKLKNYYKALLKFIFSR